MKFESYSATEYHHVMKQLRSFFEKKNLIEAELQSRISILAACEDVFNVAPYQFPQPGSNEVKTWPMIQTNQMSLEFLLMENPTAPGFFCTTTSYRNEASQLQNPERYARSFAMTEVEIPGDHDTLETFECELMEHLGFGPASSFAKVEYLDACKKYGVKELGHAEEEKLYQDYGSVVLLRNFPEYTNPFFNMRSTSDDEKPNEFKRSAKTDVICGGQETIGSAQRSSDPEYMKSRFYAQSEGKYAARLFELFGKDRVEAELAEFLSLPFITRSGFGMGMKRIISGMRRAKLL